MAVDKEIFELDNITLDILTSGVDISFVAQVEGYPVDFQVPADVLAEYLGGKSKVYGGSLNPTGALGVKDDIYIQTNGKVYQKGAVSWALVVTIATGGGSSVDPVDFPIIAGTTANPLVIDLTDYPLFTKDAIFLYKIGIDPDFERFNDHQVTETSTGFSIYGHDDGTGKFAESGKITMKA